MSYQSTDGWLSLPAAADYTAVTKPRLVVQNSSMQYALCGAGAVPYGVADNMPVASGAQLRAGYVFGGVYECEVGTGGVTSGSLVASDSAGKLVAGSTGNAYIGRAHKAGAAGEVVHFTYMPSGLGTAS